MRRMIRMVLSFAVLAGCGLGDPVDSEQTATTTQALTGSNGIWENGLTTNGIWENGIWENGIWENGIWENGIWENGIWENGIWENGIWENGWKDGSDWVNGTWLHGFWNSAHWQRNPRAHAVLRDNAYARQLLAYLYSCAMPAGAKMRLDAGAGVFVDLEGGIGLWPTWPKPYSTCTGDCASKLAHWESLMPGVAPGECDETCQRWLTACLLARTNAYGVRVEISMRAPDNAPQAIKDALALDTTSDPPEATAFSVREGAFYGNLFQTYPDAAGRTVNNPVLYACAGPGSNIPQITKRFSSSQGAAGVITNTGICESIGEREAACAPPLTGEPVTMHDCKGPASGLVPERHYSEVITVYLREQITVCGNSVCEEGESLGEDDECLTDCHPWTWAKSFAQVYPPSQLVSQNYRLPLVSTTGVSPVDNSIVMVGAVHAAVTVDLGGGDLAGDGGSHWDLVLVKYSSDGSYVWGRRYPQLVRLEPNAVAIDRDGHIAVAAEREYVYSDQAWIGKFDPDGNMLPGWPRTYGGEAHIGIGGFSIHRVGLEFDAAGNLVLAARYVGTPTFGSHTFTSEGFTGTLERCCWGEPDGFVLSLAPDGGVNWAQPLGGDRPAQLALDSQGHVLVSVLDWAHGHRVVKLDVFDGEPRWIRTLPTRGTNDETVGVAVDPNTDDVFVTGRMAGTFDFGGLVLASTSSDLYVVKYASYGTPRWARLSNAIIASGSGWAYMRGSHIAVGAAGDVIVAGDFQTYNGGLVDFGRGRLDSHAIFDPMVLSYRGSDGHQQWARHFPAVLFGMPHSMKVDSRGYIVYTGYFDGSLLIDDILLVNDTPELTQHPNVFLASFPPPGISGIDTTPPTLDRFPKPIYVQATSSAGARVWYMPPTASDTGRHGVSVYCSPPPNSMFPRGTTTVTCTATDSFGNAASGTFPVTVGDDLGPVITGLVGPIEVSANAPGGAFVIYPLPTAVDQVDGARPVSCKPASGSLFPVGTTTVRCTSTDASGNTATRTFPVTVVDKTPPELYVPQAVMVPATSSSGAVVTYSAYAYDLVEGYVSVYCVPQPKTLFPLGRTNVKCTAKDKAGNASTRQFPVDVQVQWSGILQPVNADGSSVFSSGSTVPLRFSLTGASSQITTLAPKLSVKKLSSQITGTVKEASSKLTPDQSEKFYYDPKTMQYAYNLGTQTKATGDYEVTIDLGDGVTRTVRFSLAYLLK